MDLPFVASAIFGKLGVRARASPNGGGLCSPEVLEVLEVMRLVLLCMLEAVEGALGSP